MMSILPKRLCGKITRHRFRRGLLWTEREPREYYSKCLLCGKGLWSRKPHRRYIRYVRRRGERDG